MVCVLRMSQSERPLARAVIATVLTAWASSVPVHAQQEIRLIAPEPNEGFSRIQGRENTAPPPPPPPSEEILMDMREEMRKFVISIAQIGRQYRSDFRIIARGGLDLLVKRDDVDEEKTSPARTYLRALDGVIAEGMFFTERRPGKPPPPERQAEMLGLADYAKKNGVRVFTLDYGNDSKFVDKAHAEAQKRDFVSLVSSRPLLETSSLPTYPRRPFGENPESILSLGQVRNFIAVTNSIPYGRQDNFALTLHGTNYDMVIVDVFHGRQPLSQKAVETLKYKKVGAKRLVVARMDIGSAASYMYYWKNSWAEGSPPFINAPHRGDPDRYHVEYWQPGWKNLIAGDTNSYLYGIIRQGFDGVLIDGLDAYKFFEGGSEEDEAEQ
ncbi:MAG: hypothetical protein CMF67_03995 [Magnetovibrio sp.]|nr:hypothetical protein [Magnetovibrio sp.]